MSKLLRFLIHKVKTLPWQFWFCTWTMSLIVLAILTVACVWLGVLALIDFTAGYCYINKDKFTKFKEEYKQFE